MMEIRNAKIRSTMLGREDHGILTGFVYLDYGGSAQGFGGYSLDSSSAMAVFVGGVLDTLKVATWEQLPGTPVRVEHSSLRVTRIGHFIEDRWFDVEAAMAEVVP